jgi:predicted AAA+ superfamily ATPase
MGGLSNRMGDIVERLVATGILNRFKELGYTFDKMSRNALVLAPDGEKREVDMELHNGEDVMLIEIKAKPNEEDVDDHAERIGFLKNLNKYPGKNIYGAIAGAVFSESGKRYAMKKGFFVIEQSGDTMRIETLGGTFKPRKW